MNVGDLIVIGIGLAMDAGCTCTVSGLVYKPKISKMLKIACPFAIFQGIMPLIGYFLAGLLPAKLFMYNHFIAFIILSIIGLKMIQDAKNEDQDNGEKEYTIHKVSKEKKLTVKILVMQAFFTSIDALSVGITLNYMSVINLLSSVTIIAMITFGICFIALIIGKKIGTKFNEKAEILGGIILILLGIKLFYEGLV